jgi:hypothetical protein
MSTIYAIAYNQLGNSFRLFSTLKILADYLNRPFKIDIRRLHLHKDIIVLNDLFSEYIDHNPVYREIHSHEINVTGLWTTQGVVIETLLKNIPEDSFGIDYIHAARLPEMTEDEFIIRKLDFYKHVKFPKFEFPIANNHIGVHIRYTDNMRDNGKVELKINTPIEVFMDKLETIEKPFILCTDNPSVREQVMNRWPMTILPPTCSNSNYQHLMEMMLLSKTKRIIGSAGSTFSYEAAFFRGTDIEVYENSTWNLYEISKYTNRPILQNDQVHNP